MKSNKAESQAVPHVIQANHIKNQQQAPVYQIILGFNTDPRDVIHKMLAGIDISLVDPHIFPMLLPFLDNMLERAKVEGDSYKIKELSFYIDYINYQPRREELSRILYRPRPPPPVKPPALTEDQISTEVDLILKTETIPHYMQEEIELIVGGLRERRAMYIRKGDYLQAEKAEFLSRKLFNSGLLTSVEVIQQDRVKDLRSKLKEAEADLRCSQEKWEELQSKLHNSANSEFSELEKQHEDTIKELEYLFDQPPPASIRKYSQTLLNLRRREEAMLSSKLYADASIIKAQADELQCAEDREQIERWHRQIGNRIEQTKKEQMKQLRLRKMFWRTEEEQMVREANSEIEQAKKAIDHLKNNLRNNVEAKKVTSVMKKETRKKKKTTRNLPVLGTPRRDEKKTEYRQRQILNFSIYTITNRNTPIKTPKRPNTSIM